MRATTRLRQLLRSPELVVAPGAYDAITARLIAQAGFSAVYMTGAGVSASLGYPDYGLVTMSEMVERAGVLARSVSVPVISDADTGYGNELNVTRTVREFEARGVAAIHIEDQVTPKRCGHLDDKELIGLGEYVSKIKAAVAARQDPDFVIIARSDARTVNGFDDAIARVNAALEAGADVAFFESPTTAEEVAAIPRLVKGDCLLNLAQGGRTPMLPFDQVREMGYRLAILPGALLVPAIAAAEAALSHILTTGTVATPAANLSIREVFRRVGADDWDAVRSKIASGAILEHRG
jgi:2-methylisocitrate lyase-like PEP mutase family enzyme